MTDATRLPPTVRELLREQRANLVENAEEAAANIETVRAKMRELERLTADWARSRDRYRALIADIDAALADPTNTATLDAVSPDGKLP